MGWRQFCNSEWYVGRILKVGATTTHFLTHFEIWVHIFKFVHFWVHSRIACVIPPWALAARLLHATSPSKPNLPKRRPSWSSSGLMEPTKPSRLASVIRCAIRAPPKQAQLLWLLNLAGWAWLVLHRDQQIGSCVADQPIWSFWHGLVITWASFRDVFSTSPYFTMLSFWKTSRISQ